MASGFDMAREKRLKKGRISRIGSYAIASSIRDHHHHPVISCTTFNILAPIYKRLNLEVLVALPNRHSLCINQSVSIRILGNFFHYCLQNSTCRESDCRTYWLRRNRAILDWLIDERSSIICLQVDISSNLQSNQSIFFHLLHCV